MNLSAALDPIVKQLATYQENLKQAKAEIKKLKTQLKEEREKTKCTCSPSETTGWTEFPCCNVCGKIVDEK